jgi:Nuclease-related domain
MRQHHDPDPYEEDEEELEELGTPVYQGTGLSVRALTAEELQRFLDAHHDQPARLLGSGWDAATAPRPPHGSQVGNVGSSDLLSSTPEAPPAGPVSDSLGSPGRSALAAARRRRATELAAWARTLVWRAPLVAAAGLVAQVLAAQVGLPYGGLVGLVAAALAGWRLRFRPSQQVTAWQRGAHGERRTARLLDRLTGDGYVVFHDLAVPGSDANVDHLVIGPSGVFVIDSKQWAGSVHQGSDGLAWHNHYPLDRTLETVRWEAETVGRLLGARAAAVVCVHGAHVHGGGLEVQGVAIVPPHLLRGALGFERVLSDAEVALLAATARASLRPAV